MSTITITGIGGSSVVTVEDGATIAEALSAANVNPADQGLNVNANGANVTDPSNVTVQDGDQIVTTPREAKLGS